MSKDIKDALIRIGKITEKLRVIEAEGVSDHIEDIYYELYVLGIDTPYDFGSRDD